MKPQIVFRTVRTKPASARIRSLYKGLAAILTLGLGIPALSSIGEAQGRPEPPGVVTTSNSHSISMGVGKSVVVELPRDATEVVVGNPGVVNAVVRTPRKIYLMGAGQGQTTIFAVDSQGRQFANYEISVGRDVGELGPLLKAALPRSEIVPRTVNETIILTGTVASPGEAQKAVDIAKGFAARVGQAAGGGGGAGEGNVVNALVIRGEDQVMLKVTVAEVDRQVLKQLGVSTDTGGQNLLSGAWGVLHNENPFAINATLSSSNLTINGPTGSNTAATLKAFERYSVARILAEPSVTAVSGESAKVVVGGEIAVPGGGSQCLVMTNGTSLPLCTPSIMFKPYGVTLSFTPVVQAEGRITVHLSTEVTEVDLTTTQSYVNVSVPGFKTRKNESTIELPSGASMATAGLLESKSAAAINGIPGLLNLPVLGALFRSRDYQRQETELLIIVTPYIVKPLSPHDVVRPDDNFNDASDPQAWLLGRVNRIYSTRNNPALNDNFRGRIGFIHD